MAVKPKENPRSCQRIDGFFWTFPALSATILAGKVSIVVMLPYERHERILAALREERFLKIEDLLRLTRSSLTTLRRDIDQLAEDGRLRKSRGGVLQAEREQSGGVDPQYRLREKVAREEKERIGAAAQRHIADGDVIVLLNGTTTRAVAEHLDPAKRVTIITNGIDIVAALRGKPNAEVILLGGVVEYAHNTLGGPLALKSLGELHAVRLISGAGGITAEKGVTIYPYLVAAYYPAIVRMVNEVILVADRSKLGRNALVQATTLEEVDAIVTNRVVPPEYIELFARHGVRCEQV
jgi:DeoR/GlpR family transcriptional regulator of sugar metabolism